MSASGTGEPPPVLYPFWMEEGAMSISEIQIPSDQRLIKIINFIGCRLDEIGSAVESKGLGVYLSGSLSIEPDNLEDWDEGYLAALNDLVVFIQGMDSSAAA